MMVNLIFLQFWHILIRQKNTPWEADVVASESKISLSEVAGNTERKTSQTRRPEEFYQNWNTPGDNGRFDRTVCEKSLQIKYAMHHTFIGVCFLFTRFTWIQILKRTVVSFLATTTHVWNKMKIITAFSWLFSMFRYF